MSRRFWIAAMVLLFACMGLALAASWNMASAVKGGAEGARRLQDRLQGSFSAVGKADPPLRVFAMLPAREGEGWRWKVEATLQEGRTPADPMTVRALERMVFHGLSERIRGKPPAGILLVLHVPGAPDWTRTYDDQGRAR
jgi:hypothetical protein